MFGGRAPGRPGLDRRPRPRGRGDRPRRAPDPGGAAPRTGRMRSAFLSPHPSPGGRGRPMTQPPGVRPARAWRSPAPPLPPQPRRPRSGAASRPASLPSPAPSGPSSPRWPLHPFPRHKPGDRYPAWPTARRSGERRGAAATAAPSARLGSARPGPPRAPPPAAAPRPPLGLAPLTRTRARPRPRCSTYLQCLSGHHSPSRTRAAPGPRAALPPPWAAAPLLGRGASGRLPHAGRPPAGPPPARLRRAARAAAPRAPADPARPPARSASTSRRRRLRPFPRSRLPRRLPGRGWQTSTCCWRSPRTETGNPEPRGKPGRRGAG